MAVVGDARRAAEANPARFTANGWTTGMPTRSVPIPGPEEPGDATTDLTARRTLVAADLAIAEARLTTVRAEAADLLADAVDQASLIVRGTNRAGREIVRAAQAEGDRILRDAEERASRIRQQAEEQARAEFADLPDDQVAEQPHSSDSGLEEAIRHVLQIAQSLAQLEKRRESERESELFATRIQASREITAKLVEFDHMIGMARADMERQLGNHRRRVHGELAARIHTVRDRLAASLQAVRTQAQVDASSVLQRARDEASALLTDARATSNVQLQRANEAAECLLADARRHCHELSATARDEHAAATKARAQAERELSQAQIEVTDIRREAAELLRTARAEADDLRGRARLSVEQARAEATEAKQVRRRLETEIHALLGVIDGLAVAGRPIAGGRGD